MINSYSAQRYQLLRQSTKFLPYWRYMTAGDDRVRMTHKALHGQVWAADSPVWAAIFPPNGFRCRCRVEALRKAEKLSKLTPEEARNYADPGWRYNVGRGIEVKDYENFLNAAEADDLVGLTGYGIDSAMKRHDRDSKDFPPSRGEITGGDKSKLKAVQEAYKPEFEKAWGVAPGESTYLEDERGFGAQLSETLFEHGATWSKIERHRLATLAKEAFADDIYEAWLNRFTDKKTGKVSLGINYVKKFRVGKEKNIVVVATLDELTGNLVYTYYEDATDSRINRIHRTGVLLYKNDWRKR